MSNAAIVEVSKLTITREQSGKRSSFWGGRRVPKFNPNYINEATFSLFAGDRVMVDGLENAQKTALIRTLAGLLPLQEGSIRCEGSVFPGVAPSFGIHPRASVHQNLVLRGLMLEKTGRSLQSFVRHLAISEELSSYLETPYGELSKDRQALFSIISLGEQSWDVVFLERWMECNSIEIKSRSRDLYRKLMFGSRAALVATPTLRLNQKVCNKVLTADWELSQFVEESTPMNGENF